MKVKVGPGFAVFLLLIAWWDPARVFWWYLAAVGLHEAGHVAAVILCGGQVRELQLGFGDARIVTGFMNYRQELVSAAAGPAVNLLCGLAFRTKLPVFAGVSLLLGLYNLLPILPLDGGRITMAALCLLLSEQKAVLFARITSAISTAALLTASAILMRKYAAGLFPLIVSGNAAVRLLLAWRNEKSVAFPAARG